MFEWRLIKVSSLSHRFYIFIWNSTLFFTKFSYEFNNKI